MTELNKEEIVEIAGKELVELAENENCEATSRLTDGTPWDGYDEWKGVAENGRHRVTAVYMQDSEATKDQEPDTLNWEIDFYEIDYI